MNERELDQAKVETYKRVVEFARDAVEKELKKLENRRIEINGMIHRLENMGVRYNDKRIRELSLDLKRTNFLLEKENKDLNYLNSILNNFQTFILNYNDSYDIQMRKKELEDIIDDINLVRSDAEKNNRENDLNNIANVIKGQYETKIRNEKKQNKRSELAKEKNRILQSIEDRKNKLNIYVNMSDIERQAAITKLNSDISTLLSTPAKTSEEKLQDAILLIKPLFMKYNNTYGGENVEVKEVGGESMFKYIMKSTDTYSKIGDDIDKLESKLNSINSINKSKGKKEYFIGQELKGEVSRKEMLPYRIRDMKNKQAMVKNEQKIVMLKRQQVIDKKNKKISNLEGKAKQLREEATFNNHNNPILKGIENVNSTRKKFKAWRTEVRIKALKKTPILLKSSRFILLTEELKNEFLRRSTYLYDIKNEQGIVIHKKGDMDYRMWQEQVLERMENEEEYKQAIKNEGKSL